MVKRSENKPMSQEVSGLAEQGQGGSITTQLRLRTSPDVVPALAAGDVVLPRTARGRRGADRLLPTVTGIGAMPVTIVVSDESPASGNRDQRDSCAAFDAAGPAEPVLRGRSGEPPRDLPPTARREGDDDQDPLRAARISLISLLGGASPDSDRFRGVVARANEIRGHAQAEAEGRKITNGVFRVDSTEFIDGIDIADTALIEYLAAVPDIPEDIDQMSGRRALDRRIAGVGMLLEDLGKLEQGLQLIDEASEQEEITKIESASERPAAVDPADVPLFLRSVLTIDDESEIHPDRVLQAGEVRYQGHAITEALRAGNLLQIKSHKRTVAWLVRYEKTEEDNAREKRTYPPSAINTKRSEIIEALEEEPVIISRDGVNFKLERIKEESEAEELPYSEVTPSDLQQRIGSVMRGVKKQPALVKKDGNPLGWIVSLDKQEDVSDDAHTVAITTLQRYATRTMNLVSEPGSTVYITVNSHIIAKLLPYDPESFHLREKTIGTNIYEILTDIEENGPMDFTYHGRRKYRLSVMQEAQSEEYTTRSVQDYHTKPLKVIHDARRDRKPTLLMRRMREPLYWVIPVIRAAEKKQHIELPEDHTTCSSTDLNRQKAIIFNEVEDTGTPTLITRDKDKKPIAVIMPVNEGEDPPEEGCLLTSEVNAGVIAKAIAAKKTIYVTSYGSRLRVKIVPYEVETTKVSQSSQEV